MKAGVAQTVPNRAVRFQERRTERRTNRPWGKNDQIFPAAGAEPYKRDLKTLDYHLLDAGHFALETNGAEIAKLMREFFGKHVAKK